MVFCNVLDDKLSMPQVESKLEGSVIGMVQRWKVLVEDNNGMSQGEDHLDHLGDSNC